MRYRVVTYIDGNNELSFVPQFKFKYSPFWFNFQHTGYADGRHIISFETFDKAKFFSLRKIADDKFYTNLKNKRVVAIKEIS